MSILIPGAGGQAIDELVDRVLALGHDLDRYRNGIMPTAEELAEAPRIDFYRPVLDTSAFRYAGITSRHPLIDGGLGMTSQVYAIAEDRTWVRTLSRVWRLGRPANDNGRSDA